MTAANARLRNAREEREQFDEASNQILQHFNTKEDELSRSVASYRAEADACNAFIVFLEATWGFHSSYTEQKEKQVSDELKRHEEYFVNLAVCLLSAYKDELGPTLDSIRKLVENLRGLEIATIMADGNPQASKARKHLEEEYLESEAKLITMFNVVESIKKQFVTQNMENSRKGDERIKELCDSLGKIKDEFQSMERPILEIETLTLRAKTPVTQRSKSLPLKQSPQDKFVLGEGPTSQIKSPKNVPSKDSAEPSPSPTLKQNTTRLEQRRQSALPGLNLPKVAILSNPQDVLSKFSLALEEDSRDGSMEDIGDWEFDEPEEQQKPPQNPQQNRPGLQR